MKRKCTVLALLVLLAPSSHALEFSSLDYEPTVPYIMFIGTGGTLNESVDLVDANGGVALATSQVTNIFIDGQLTVGWFFFDAAAIAADPPAHVTVRTATEESAVYTLPPLPPPCIDKDWTAGAPTTTECMPESDRSVFLEEEFFDSQGTSVRRLVEPEEWCRADLVQQRLYWPREAGANCAVWPQAQIDMSTAANASRQYWEGLGCQDHYKPYTVTFEVEFTPLLMDFTSGAFSPLMGDGHIFLDSASVQASQDFRVGAVLHEMTHAAVQFSIFPSAIADAWGQSRLWPEAIATVAMIDQMPGSSYFSEIHGPWPHTWTGGLTFGPNKARHAALLIKYLNGARFNSCEFMLEQHASLLSGDEITAFRNEFIRLGFINEAFDILFARFVAAYNLRDSGRIEDIDLLGLSAPSPEIMPSPAGFYGIGNGMVEGDTRVFNVDVLEDRGVWSYEFSPRCPLSMACFVVSRPNSNWSAVQCGAGGYMQPAPGSDKFLEPGLWAVTLASVQGDAHMRELAIYGQRMCLSPPCDPWPAQDTNDPYPSGCP